jgi:hypothetical protein
VTETVIPERKSVPFIRIMLVFAALFVMGVVVAFWLHRTYVAADRVVAKHVAPDIVAAVRIDLEKATLFAPVRRFLLPLLEPEGAVPGQTRWERVAARSELVVGRDTREVLAMWGPGVDDWAIALGGNYPADAIGTVAGVLGEEREPWRLEGGTLRSPSGHALSQATDRALLLASGSKRLASVLGTSDAHDRLGIPLKGAFAFAGDPSRLPWLSEALGALGPVSRLTAHADWSSPLVVQLELHYAAAPPTDAGALVNAQFAALIGAEEAKRLLRVVGPPTVETRSSSLVVTTRWDHIALERLAEQLAVRLRQRAP